MGAPPPPSSIRAGISGWRIPSLRGLRFRLARAPTARRKTALRCRLSTHTGCGWRPGYGLATAAYSSQRTCPSRCWSASPRGALTTRSHTDGLERRLSLQPATAVQPMVAGIDIYTVGHSTRSQDQLLEILHAAGIGAVVDVRSFPSSRRHPEFNRGALEQWLPEAGIDYLHFGELGGRRNPVPGSPNDGWRERGFRGYADHMAS